MRTTTLPLLSLVAAPAWAQPAPPADAANVAGYRVYWRLTDSPTWDYSRWVGNATEHTFEGIIIDNYFFGAAAVGASGNESVVVFP